ncbi:MAG TPA: GspH/FimT family pseudopilin [Patescibacteria group bacterium]|nr:GspH/FimT family pseudopilin [Patescibacteria group bacterium]
MNQYFRQGISIVEVLVVISIILILSVVSFAALTRVAPHYRLTGSAREMVAALREAQSSTVSTQARHLVRFNLGNDSYTNYRLAVDGSETEVSNTNLSRGIRFFQVNLTNNQITFTPSSAPLNYGTIILNNNLGEKITIEITPVGQIKTY